MRRSVIGWIVLAVLAVAGAGFAYVFFLAGGSGEPTTQLTTPELSATTTSTMSGSGPSSSAQTATGITFEIDQTRSTARFEIDETLRGSPNHVVGTTDQVVGQFEIEPSDLSTVEFSEIIVNARTLTTDSDRRDRTIRGPVILDSGSDSNELITLAVTSVDGLSGGAEVGATFDFTITGDLTVKGSTAPVMFDVSVTWVDDMTLEGSATAEITRDMFGIGIPNVPLVADVSNEVVISLEFVATAS